MGGGLMQLVAYGAQDVFLTGKPEISFFKVVYRRHTNFATESILQTLNGTTAWGSRLTSTISRNGDLVTNMWLEVTLPGASSDYVNSIGHSLIEYVELEIGGQRIDKHYGEFLEILSELTCPEEKLAGFKQLVGKRTYQWTDGSTDVNPMLNSSKVYIPLQFFFCRNPGLALPLIALQYHEVKINLKLRAGDDVVRTAGSAGTLADVKLFVDYVYLDTTERRRFAQMQHEYLIEQLQYTGPAKATDSTQRLNFNHPIKELIWVYRKSSDEHVEPLNFNFEGGGKYPFDAVANVATTNVPVIAEADWSVDYIPVVGDVVPSKVWFDQMKLLLNGHDRFTERDEAFFRLMQPYEHHTRVPIGNKIYVYSFALNPESHQPSGTCNFSRLDNVQMKFTGPKGADGDELMVFAVNYNVLRIMSGMGGLAYSN